VIRNRSKPTGVTPKIRGIIFDLDGVLLSTDEFHYRAWKELADREGIPFDRTINHRLRGVSRMDSLNIILEKAGRPYGEEEKAAMADFKNRRYRELLGNLMPEATTPAVWKLLAELRRRGIRLAVGSASKNTPTIMQRVGLDKVIDVVVDGNDITRGKPDPEVFLKAAERLGLKPDECVVVEDAPTGVEAGRRAGMHVLAIGGRELHPDEAWLAPSLDAVSADALLACGRA
jgi:beta-phosphoglucomutase